MQNRGRVRINAQTKFSKRVTKNIIRNKEVLCTFVMPKCTQVVKDSLVGSHSNPPLTLLDYNPSSFLRHFNEYKQLVGSVLTSVQRVGDVAGMISS